MIINQPKMIKKETIFGQPKRILKTAFFIFLLSLILTPIFSQTAAATVCPQNHPRCYNFQIVVDPDGDGVFENYGGPGNSGSAYFPGLVPCGVRVCINQDWIEVDRDDYNNPIFTPNLHEIRQLAYRECRSTAPGIGDGIRMHHCTLCHLFIMFFAIVSFIFVDLVPLLAVIILALAGGTIIFAGNNPELAKKGKGIIKGVVIGLVLIYGAFIITSAFFAILGVIQWEGFDGNLFSVRNCDPIRIEREMVRPVN